MGKINWTRVLVGGLLAGLILNVLGFAAWAAFLGRAWRAALETLGHPIHESAGFIVLSIVLYFVLGILAVWLYAAIRPRYGSGPKTAVLAGFGLWLLSGLLPTISWGSLRLFSARLLTIDVLTYLVILIVATLLGAWLYKEQAS
jgi:hypothetical protein